MSRPRLVDHSLLSIHLFMSVCLVDYLQVVLSLRNTMGHGFVRLIDCLAVLAPFFVAV